MEFFSEVTNKDARIYSSCEVSPRDSIQNEKKVLSTLKKEELISRAIDSGFKRIEVTSFVNPKKYLKCSIRTNLYQVFQSIRKRI